MQHVAFPPPIIHSSMFVSLEYLKEYKFFTKPKSFSFQFSFHIILFDNIVLRFTILNVFLFVIPCVSCNRMNNSKSMQLVFLSESKLYSYLENYAEINIGTMIRIISIIEESWLSLLAIDFGRKKTDVNNHKWLLRFSFQPYTSALTHNL